MESALRASQVSPCGLIPAAQKGEAKELVVAKDLFYLRNKNLDRSSIMLRPGRGDHEYLPEDFLDGYWSKVFRA